jgi:hypothetical protein
LRHDTQIDTVAVQEQEPVFDPNRAGLLHEALEHVFQWLSLGDRRQRNRESLPLEDEVGGGVGVEKAGFETDRWTLKRIREGIGHQFGSVTQTVKAYGRRPVLIHPKRLS